MRYPDGDGTRWTWIVAVVIIFASIIGILRFFAVAVLRAEAKRRAQAYGQDDDALDKDNSERGH